MIGEPFFLECVAGIGTAVILAYLLGHYRGLEQGLTERRDPYARPFGDVAGSIHSGAFNIKEQSDRER